MGIWVVVGLYTRQYVCISSGDSIAVDFDACKCRVMVVVDATIVASATGCCDCCTIVRMTARADCCYTI